MLHNPYGELADLIDWRNNRPIDVIEPWKPHTLTKLQWADRDYAGVYAWRLQTLAMLRADPLALASAKVYYSTRPDEFIMHWFDTYDPRIKIGSKWVPFVFFERQAEFIAFLHECRQTSESGLIEKSRDMGATWGSVAYSLWSWLFIDNDAIGWGSRKQDLVDNIGDPDSIFEKMRLLLGRLPDVFMPKGFKWREHFTFMQAINPENGSVITGEAGDAIGRGGRKSMYFKDESAHYERPEKIESALGDNTNVQIDISSVNGLGNPFHRRREAGVIWVPGKTIEPGYVRVFIMDWRDHPEKTQAWYDQRRAKHEREGALHILAQEVDRDYAAAVSNNIIPMIWIEACVDAHLTIPYVRAIMPPNVWSASLDVADGGMDRNALCLRQWIIWRHSEEWGERDPGVTTRKTLDLLRVYKGLKVQYDCIGVGAAVKSEFNRQIDVIEEECKGNPQLRFERLKDFPKFVPWNAGGGVLDPAYHVIPDDEESALNRDFFANMKAQAWWSMRIRCYKTFKAVTEGVVYPVEELISLDSQNPLIQQVKKELAQPTSGQSAALLKMVVDKKPDGTRSPNNADAGIMAFFPLPENYGETIIGVYG